MPKEFEYGREQREREERETQAKAEQARLKQQQDQEAARQRTNEHLEKLRQENEAFIQKYPAVKAAVSAYSDYLGEKVTESKDRRYQTPHEATSGSSVFTTVKDITGKEHSHLLLSVYEGRNNDELVVSFQSKSTPDSAAKEHVEQIAAALREETGMKVRLDQKWGDDPASQATREYLDRNPPRPDPNYKPPFTGQIR